jgi:aldose 1-epimerase
MTSHELENNNGLRVSFLDLGGIITSIAVPDRQGESANVVLAYDSVSSYLEDAAYLGALVGRYANRIANARFSIGGRECRLAANNGQNHLHGGIVGFNRRRWSVVLETGHGYSRAVLELVSESGDEGYPGRLAVRVTYTLTDENELVVDYHATSTEATHVNLTQHSYFNLSGSGSTDILGHELTVGAAHFTPVDSSLIPTGEIRPVHGTPFDFRIAKLIGANIDDDDEQLRFGEGYDHNFVLAGAVEDEVRFAATLRDPRSGRVMHIDTTEPGIQVYSGNKLSAALPVAMGKSPHRRGGIALETQHFPDSPNNPEFPSTLLKPDEVYRSRTVYRFTTDRA